MENGDLHKTIQELTTEVAVLKTRIDAKEEALGLQAREYERRLHDLNDAHKTARDVLKTYVPRELFDRDMAALSNRIVDVYDRVRILTDTVTAFNAAYSSKVADTTTTWARILGLGTAAAAIGGLITHFIWH